MKKTIIALILILTYTIFLNSCANVESTDKLKTIIGKKSQTGSINFRFQLPSKYLANPSIKAAFVDNRDQVITKITALLRREGFANKSMDLLIEGNSAYGTIDYLVIGEWNLSLKAYNKDNELLAGGVTVVTILESEIAKANIQMEHYQVGGAEIEVTWGQNSDTTPVEEPVVNDEALLTYDSSSIILAKEVNLIKDENIKKRVKTNLNALKNRVNSINDSMIKKIKSIKNNYNKMLENAKKSKETQTKRYKEAKEKNIASYNKNQKNEVKNLETRVSNLIKKYKNDKENSLKNIENKYESKIKNNPDNKEQLLVSKKTEIENTEKKYSKYISDARENYKSKIEKSISTFKKRVEDEIKKNDKKIQDIQEKYKRNIEKYEKERKEKISKRRSSAKNELEKSKKYYRDRIQKIKKD